MKFTASSAINGTQTFKAYDNDGLLYPVNPINEYIILSISDIKKTRLYSFTLGDYVDHDLLIQKTIIRSKSTLVSTFWTEDLVKDGSHKCDLYFYKNKDENSKGKYSLINKDGLLEKFLLQDNNYQIATNFDIDEVILLCKPIIIREKIKIEASEILTTNTSKTEDKHNVSSP